MSSSVYVVFNNDNSQWWRLFLNPINHCYLVIPQGKDLIVYGKCTDAVEIYTTNDIKRIINGSIVIKANINQSNRGLFMLNTCVGTIKQYLGISRLFIWTPYQLLKYLR